MRGAEESEMIEACATCQSWDFFLSRQVPTVMIWIRVQGNFFRFLVVIHTSFDSPTG
jgi:hypothetical protein